MKRFLTLVLSLLLLRLVLVAQPVMLRVWERNARITEFQLDSSRVSFLANKDLLVKDHEKSVTFPFVSLWKLTFSQNGSPVYGQKMMMARMKDGSNKGYELRTVDSITFNRRLAMKKLAGSNCYMVVPNSTTILIPVLRANQSDLGVQIGPTDALTAELVWTDHPNRLAPNATIRSIGVSGVGASGYVAVTPGSAEGNAVVAVKVNGDIKWSWHIWVTNYNPALDMALYPSGAKAMNRNLGALSNVKTDGVKTFGMHYQWGRKDPFPGSSSNSSGVEPTLYTAIGTTSVVKSQAPATSGTGNNLGASVSNPSVFYYGVSASNYDWYVTHSTTAGNNYLWWTDKGEKSIYDPCPQGWRVVRNSEQVGFVASNFAWDAVNKGRVLSSSGQFVWFPASGYRHYSGGTLSSVGSGGYHWSSSPSTASYGYYLYFTSTYITPSSSTYRAIGFPLRCVQE